jgi:hypothetical protein
MKERGLFGRIERHHLALLCLAVLVALAGCAGGTSNGTATETPANTTTPTDSPDGGDSFLPSEASIDNFSAGEDLNSELTPAEELSVSGDEVVSDALTAIESVESYRLAGDSTIRTQTNNVDQTQEIQRETRVDRQRPALSVNSTVSARGQTLSQRDYYVNGTLYQNSPRLASQYGSEWIRQNISENFTQILDNADRLSLYRNVLENGTATLEGAQTVDGEQTYRIQVRTDGTAAASVLGIGELNNSDAALVTTFWVDADNSTIVRAEGAIEIVTTQRGQAAVVSGTFVETLTYGGVEVTVPEAAATAVEIGATGTTN